MRMLDRYEEVVGHQEIERLRQLASGLEGKKIVHVNSTRTGGGVAEILGWMIPMMEELGIDADATELFPFWYRGPASFAHGMVYRLDHDGPFQLQVEEIVCGEFARIDGVLERVKNEPFCPDGVDVLNQFLKFTFSARMAPRER